LFFSIKQNRLVGGKLKKNRNLPLFISKEILSEKNKIFFSNNILTNAKGKAPLSVIKLDERLRDINVRL